MLTTTALQSPPGPRGHFLLGSFLDFRRDTLGTFFRARKEFGDVVEFRLGPKKVVVLSHPDLVERVFIDDPETFPKLYRRFPDIGLALVLGRGVFTAVGEKWQHQRNVMKPMFYRSQITSMVPSIAAAGERLIKNWDKKAGSETPVDVLTEMSRVTGDVITETMFSADVLSHSEALARDMAICVRYIGESFTNPLMPSRRWPTPRNLVFNRATKNLRKLVLDMIAQHKPTAGARKNLLDLLLAAHAPDSGEAVDLDLVRDEVLGIFAAGHETNSCTLTWTWYLLDQHPEALARLRRELRQVLNGRSPTVEDLPKLPYARMLIQESMRLYSPIPIMPRVADKDTEIRGYRIAAGTVVLTSIFNIHRHPDFWTKPEEFDPERFSDHDRGPTHRCAYLPFGVGPRVCMGSHFALTELTLLLAQIAQHYDVRMVPGQRVELDAVTTLRPRYPLMATLHRLQ